MNWLEETPLEFNTPMGPVWPAAKYLAVCSWPDNQDKRAALIRALLRAGAEAAGYKYPWNEHHERVLQRIDKAAYRLQKHGFVVAEMARQLTLPSKFNIPVRLEDPQCYYIEKYTAGTLPVLLPHHRAVGRGDKVSLKKLHLLINRDFKKRSWKPFLPAAHLILGLQDQFPPQKAADGTTGDRVIPDLVTLCRETSWLDPALVCAERWMHVLFDDAGISGEKFIRLFRA